MRLVVAVLLVAVAGLGTFAGCGSPPEIRPAPIAAGADLAPPAPPQLPALPELVSSRETAALAEAITLEPGWNMIAFPVDEVTSVSPGPGVMSNLYTFSGGSYVAVALSPEALNADGGTGRGFWAFSSQASSLGYSGTAPSGARHLDLEPGFHMLGFPLASGVEVADMRVTPEGGVMAALAGSVCTQRPPNLPDACSLHQYAFPYSAGAYGTRNLADPQAQFAPGDAAWVYAHRPVRLHLVPPAGVFAYAATDGGKVEVLEVDPVSGSPAGRSSISGVASTALCAHPSLPFLYAAGSDRVDVLRISPTGGTLSAAGSISVGSNPRRLRVVPGGKVLLVVEAGTDTVSSLLVDPATGLLTAADTETVGDVPTDLAVHPSGRFAYVSNENSAFATILSVDAATGALATVGTEPCGLSSQGVEVHPGGRFLYLASASLDALQMYSVDQESGDLAPLTPASVAVPDNPGGLVLNADGTVLYFPTAKAPTVEAWAVDPQSGLLSAKQRIQGVFLQSLPWFEAALHPDGGTLYLPDETRDDVAVFRVAGGSGILQRIAHCPLPANPRAVVLRTADEPGEPFPAPAALPVPAPSPFAHGPIAVVSRSTSGEVGNSVSYGPELSGDGSRIVFWSDASNLVPGDTNGRSDVFLRDLRAGQTRRVSEPTGGGQGNANSYLPALSANGEVVAFLSDASNLVAGDDNGFSDVFAHVLATATTEALSVDSTGRVGGQPSGNNEIPRLTADGSLAVFHSGASLTPESTGGATYVRDRVRRITTAPLLAQNGTRGVWSSPLLSADGRVLAGVGRPSLFLDSPTTPEDHVLTLDGWSLLRSLSSRTPGGQVPDQKMSGFLETSLSADGRFLAFVSPATNLVPGDTNGTWDAFVLDRTDGTTTRVSVSSSGTQGDAMTTDVALSGDGRFAVFRSRATSLVGGDTNGQADVFLHDRLTGQTVRVNVSAGGEQANGNSGDIAISLDGRAIAFTSAATNLVAGLDLSVRVYVVRNPFTP